MREKKSKMGYRWNTILNTDFFFIRSRTESVSGTGPNGDRDCQRPIFMDRWSRSGPVDRSSVGVCGTLGGSLCG